MGSASQFVFGLLVPSCYTYYSLGLRHEVPPGSPQSCGRFARTGILVFCTESCNISVGPLAYAQVLSPLQSWSQSEHVEPFGFGEALHMALSSCSPRLSGWTKTGDVQQRPPALHPPLFILPSAPVVIPYSLALLLHRRITNGSTLRGNAIRHFFGSEISFPLAPRAQT